jgi:glycosyltransferase involved in cell wall biosynthesis
MPLQAAFSFEPGLLQEIGRALKENIYDVIHVEHLRGSLFGLGARRLLLQNRGTVGAKGIYIPIVWDCVDCISYLFTQAEKKSHSISSRWITRLELPRTRAFEGWLTTQFDHTLVTSGIDREALLKLSDQRRVAKRASGIVPPKGLEISVIPNGVDLNYFKPDGGMRNPATLVYAGKMSYHANLTAAAHLIQEIMPRIWKRRPDVKLVIAGKNPPRSLMALAASARNHSADSPHSSTGDGPCITITGSVPDMRPYLHRATISVAPLLYGAGIQNKVLEAMSCATPVIASPRAVAALSAQAGRDFLVAEDPETFAHETVALLEDSSRRNAMGSAGRAYAEANHDWDQIGKLLESTYRQVISEKMFHSKYSPHKISS